MLPLEKTRAMIKDVVRAEGLELVDLELKGASAQRILRIFIDHPNGITHNDCVRISEQVGPLLEVEDAISGRYTLEVSSPGLTRKLKTPEDFRRFRGRLVKVLTTEEVQGSRSFRGTLSGMEGETISLDLKHSKSVAFPLKIVAKAQLELDF